MNNLINCAIILCYHRSWKLANFKADGILKRDRKNPLLYISDLVKEQILIKLKVQRKKVS
jgi:hypothetical protein